MQAIRKTLMTVGALGALALGGSALADAASTSSAASSSSTPSTAARPAQDPSKGGHQANGKTETLLTGDTAAKVKAAALAKIPGGTVLRVETDADHGSPYEAHVQKSDGTQVEVLVNSDFAVTAVNSMGAP
jgi:uncharacterized membrane protein YkoI